MLFATSFFVATLCACQALPLSDDLVFGNPEEQGSFFEGDMVMVTTRNGLVKPEQRWPDGVVPYEIKGAFDQKELNMISDAMDAYHEKTCIRFKPKIASDEDYISIQNGRSGCWSNVGRITGKQVVNLQNPACLLKVGTVIHELMHAVGFMHEQNRYDRDDFVSILWQNMQKGHNANFEKVDKSLISGYGVNYDMGSVMHYSSKAFSRNGQPTIVAKTDFSGAMGQREGFSPSDIRKIRSMYDCKERSLMS